MHEESVRKQGKADVHRVLEKDIRPSQWRHAIPANKPVIEGDFNGDGRLGYAVLVRQQAFQKRGFLIVFGNGRRVTTAAGRLGTKCLIQFS